MNVQFLRYFKNRCCRISKTSINGLLYSVSDYGYLHRTKVKLNIIYLSDGQVDRANDGIQPVRTGSIEPSQGMLLELRSG